MLEGDETIKLKLQNLVNATGVTASLGTVDNVTTITVRSAASRRRRGKSRGKVWLLVFLRGLKE